MVRHVSRPVQSSQDGPHPRLIEMVARHRATPFQRSVADHSRAAFDTLSAAVAGEHRPLIFDSGCGVGESTARLARANPGAFVIGIDKSAHRLGRGPALPENARLIRADLMDIYPLAAAAGWRLHRHTMFYPNPWPKPSHVMRRWPASPVLPHMMALGGQWELRTNWPIYAEEMKLALAEYGVAAAIAPFVPQGEAMTPFERKYAQSGHALVQLVADVTSVDAFQVPPTAPPSPSII